MFYINQKIRKLIKSSILVNNHVFYLISLTSPFWCVDIFYVVQGGGRKWDKMVFRQYLMKYYFC